jgi:hypothetical protein
MRLLILCLALALCLLASSPAGTYKGTYSGSTGGGDFTISLSQAAGGDWKAEVAFTLNGENVKTKTTSIDVDGAKIKVAYQFDVQGALLESTATGELKGDAFEGTYQTKSVPDGTAVDQGTWKATRAG